MMQPHLSKALFNIESESELEWFFKIAGAGIWSRIHFFKCSGAEVYFGCSGVKVGVGKFSTVRVRVGVGKFGTEGVGVRVGKNLYKSTTLLRTIGYGPKVFCLKHR